MSTPAMYERKLKEIEEKDARIAELEQGMIGVSTEELRTELRLTNDRIAELSDACRQKQESIDYAKERIAELEKALRYILAASADQCENYTSGIGSCFRNYRTPDATYGADRCCWPCLAHSVL